MTVLVIPPGLCQCGCGAETNVVSGKPKRYLPYHHLRPTRPLFDRFMDRVEKQPGDDGCWLWRGPISTGGYGRWIPWRPELVAHRFAYEHLVGPIPEGLTLDHLCRVRACVNPAHLEPVTRGENVMRGVSLAAQNARKTHCKWGHPLSGDNVAIRDRPGRAPLRECVACSRERSRRRHRKDAA